MQFLWASDLIARQIVPSAVLTPVVRARLAYPPNEGTNIAQAPRMRWEAAAPEATHRLFLGTDAAAVEAADTSTAGIFIGEQAEMAYVATLQTATTYYWRIDEVIAGDPQSPIKGPLWSFTTAEVIVVDDFENYIDEAPDRIFDVWLDG